MTKTSLSILGLVLFSLTFSGLAKAQTPYERATEGTRILEGEGGLSIKILVEAANLGSDELEIGEIDFPPGPAPSRGHRHTSTEIFYILSGELEHIVNGESFVLTPGMVGIVRSGDEVIHKINSADGVKALVIWVPGGEADRLSRFFEEKPIGH